MGIGNANGSEATSAGSIVARLPFKFISRSESLPCMFRKPHCTMPKKVSVSSSCLMPMFTSSVSVLPRAGDRPVLVVVDAAAPAVAVDAPVALDRAGARVTLASGESLRAPGQLQRWACGSNATGALRVT